MAQNWIIDQGSKQRLLGNQAQTGAIGLQRDKHSRNLSVGRP